LEKNRPIPFIDLARSLAPILVLWSHLGPWWCIEYPASCLSGASLWMPIRVTRWAGVNLHLNGNGGHLGVLIFFLVSGFIMSHVIRSETRSEFVMKRIFRIAPMLIAGMTITYALASALISWGLPPTLGFTAHSIGDLVRSMFLLDTIIPSPVVQSVTWSLVPEVGFYAIIAATWGILSRRPLAGSYLLIAIVAAIEVATMAIVSFTPAHYFFM
jgi:exopolysaccharide production protein ExoZ